jgi:hypothetical protein
MYAQYITRISFKPQITYLPQPIKLYKFWYCKHFWTNITTAPYCTVTYRSMFRRSTALYIRIKAGDTTVVLQKTRHSIITTAPLTRKTNTVLCCVSNRFVLVTKRQSEDTVLQWPLDGAWLPQLNVTPSTIMTYKFDVFYRLCQKMESNIRTYPKQNENNTCFT